MIFRKFTQTYKGTNNIITPYIVNAIALGLNRNLHDSIRYFSLITSQVLQQAWKNIIVCKILLNTIRYLNYIAKRQKVLKEFKFSNQQNKINYLISQGVEYELVDLLQEIGNLIDMI